MDTCAAPGCPAVIRQQCAIISTRLSLDIPSIVPSIPESKDLLHAVEVSMDGVVLASNSTDTRSRSIPACMSLSSNPMVARS